MEHEGYGIIWYRNVMEHEIYESYRIGRLRNEVECPAGLENSEVIKINHNLKKTRLSTIVSYKATHYNSK